MAKRASSKSGKKQPKVNPELEGFNIKIDTFGEISTTMNIDKINEFLNKNVDDKKLRDRDDLDFIQEKKAEEDELGLDEEEGDYDMDKDEEE
jgi:hypothetical protein